MTKQEVIVIQEMKDNADRELKSVETIDLAVKNAIHETKQEMNQEFEIALAGMKGTQYELQERYRWHLRYASEELRNDRVN